MVAINSSTSISGSSSTKSVDSGSGSTTKVADTKSGTGGWLENAPLERSGGKKGRAVFALIDPNKKTPFQAQIEADRKKEFES